MMKYTAAILLIAAISFWSSASAEHDFLEMQDSKDDESAYGADPFRRKRQPDFLTEEQVQAIKKGVRIDYADTLLSFAPKAQVETLRQKLYKAAETKYDNFDDFEKEADRIFDEVTGINFDRLLGRKTE